MSKYEQAVFSFASYKNLNRCIQYAKDNNEGVEPFIRERRNMCTVPTSQTKLNIVDILHQAKVINVKKLVLYTY